MEDFSYACTPRILKLHWRGKGILVTVQLISAEETVRWRIFVEMADKTPLEQVQFPILEGLTFNQEEYLLLPYQNGTLLKNPVENLFQKRVEVPFWLGRGRGAYINEYPAGFSYQFIACYSGENNGLYFATEDGEAYIKTFACQLSDGGKGWDYIVTNYPENIGSATVYAMPYDFVLEVFRGNWGTAGQRYRRWAVRQKWCKQPLSERSLPAAVTDVDLWRINHTNYALGTRTQEYFDTSVQLAKQLNCTLGLHWYGWNMGAPDVNYPEYISEEKKAEGWPDVLTDWNRRFSDEPANFAYNLVRNTLWGFIPTVEGGEQAELDDPASIEHLHILKQAVAFYRANEPMFLYGRLLDVTPCGPETLALEWEIDEVGRRTQILPAVEAALWETADGKQRIAAYNFSDEKVTVSVFGKTLTIDTRSFLIA